ncbi:hypothetical protein [Saccharopolyspora gregorii]
MSRARPARRSGPLPGRDLLINTVRLPETEVRRMFQEEASARLDECWTGT